MHAQKFEIPIQPPEVAQLLILKFLIAFNGDSNERTKKLSTLKKHINPQL